MKILNFKKIDSPLQPLQPTVEAFFEPSQKTCFSNGLYAYLVGSDWNMNLIFHFIYGTNLE